MGPTALRVVWLPVALWGRAVRLGVWDGGCPGPYQALAAPRSGRGGLSASRAVGPVRASVGVARQPAASAGALAPGGRVGATAERAPARWPAGGPGQRGAVVRPVVPVPLTASRAYTQRSLLHAYTTPSATTGDPVISPPVSSFQRS
jgi:hypothetical protein